MRESRQPSWAREIATLAAIGLLLLTAAPPVAQAVMVKNDLTTVFLDTFEDDTVGGQPTTSVGTWANTNGNSTVQNAAVPGASEGSQYLRLIRPSGVVTISDFGTVSSGTVTASFRAFIPVGSLDYVMQMSLTKNLDASFADVNAAPVWITVQGNNVNTYVAPGGDAAETSTGVTFLKGVWQTWKVVYTLNPSTTNDDTFTVSVDGMTSAPINAGGYGNVLDPSSLRYLDFRVGDNGTFYLDAVPEPGSLAILGLVAAVGAGGRRLRRSRTA